jgi:hypothetical protein
LAEGSLKDLYSTINAEGFESLVYKKHNLPKIDNNQGEGYVIKPNEALYDNEGQRMSIKIKNSKHLESAPVVKVAAPVKVKEEKKLSAEEEETVDKVMAYMTVARYNNVVTKFTDDEKNEKAVTSMLL